ncbi:rap guanine nucleotide exchange factor 1 [Aplochiton taeniatus]
MSGKVETKNDTQRSHLSSFTMKLKDKFHPPKIKRVTDKIKRTPDKIKRTPSKRSSKPPADLEIKNIDAPTNKTVCVLEEQEKEVVNALRYFKTIVDKMVLDARVLEMLPGSASKVLEAVVPLVQLEPRIQHSKTVSSCLTRLHQSLANLIRWSDQVMLRAVALDDKETVATVTTVIRGVLDDVKELVRLTVERQDGPSPTSPVQPAPDTHLHHGGCPAPSEPVPSAQPEPTHPDPALTQSETVHSAVKQSDPEEQEEEGSAPPKPALPSRQTAENSAPLLPPKRRQMTPKVAIVAPMRRDTSLPEQGQKRRQSTAATQATPPGRLSLQRRPSHYDNVAPDDQPPGTPPFPVALSDSTSDSPPPLPEKKKHIFQYLQFMEDYSEPQAWTFYQRPANHSRYQQRTRELQEVYGLTHTHQADLLAPALPPKQRQRDSGSVEDGMDIEETTEDCTTYNRLCEGREPLHLRASKNTFLLLVRVVDELCSVELVEELQGQLMELVFSLLTGGELCLARLLRSNILSKLEQRRQLMNCPLSLRPLAARGVAARPGTLLDFRSQDVADQLTLMDAELFYKIELPEVLLWSKEQNEEKSPNLTQFTQHFNSMSYWVRSLIILQEKAQDREKLLLKFLKVMKHLRKLNNFNSYLAILSALDSAPLRRLDWQRQTSEGLEEYSSLIDSSSSFRTYRAALADVEPPCIPYLGLILQDLTFVHLGNPDLLATSDPESSQVNFSKRWQQFNILDTMRSFQQVPYELKPSEEIVSFFNDFSDHLSEEALWELSLRIRPRNTPRSNQRHGNS